MGPFILCVILTTFSTFGNGNGFAVPQNGAVRPLESLSSSRELEVQEKLRHIPLKPFLENILNSDKSAGEDESSLQNVNSGNGVSGHDSNRMEFSNILLYHFQ